MSTPRRPVILGIVGDSAAGKTTLTGGLTKLLGDERVTHVCTDDYHKYDRRERAGLDMTALNPECNYLDILELHLERLHYGQPILKPVYDHSTGSLVRPAYLQPREFVIVEGLLGFHTPVMRQFYDIMVYLNPPEEIRRVWKIRRDTTKRGYTTDEVLAELEKREPESRAFIRPQREFADIIVQFYPPPGVEPTASDIPFNVKLVLRPTVPHPDFTYLIDKDPCNDSGVRLCLGRDSGKPVDILEIDGNVSPEQAICLEDSIWKRLPDLRPLRGDEFGAYQDQTGTRHSDPLALTQLLLTYHLLRAHRGVSDRPLAPPVAALSRINATPAPVEAAAGK